MSSHLIREIELELPFWRYYEIHRTEPYSFLLDSACDPDRLGRFSFVGANPFLVYNAKRRPGVPPEGGADIEVITRRSESNEEMMPPEVRTHVGDVFEELRTVFERARGRTAQDPPVPFLSGAIGYFGYEAGYFIEELPDSGADDLGLPDVCFMFVDEILAHDHRLGRSYLAVRSSAARRDAEHRWQRLETRIRDFEKTSGQARQAPEVSRTSELAFNTHFDRESYMVLVERAKAHILRGDIFEVCTTHRMDVPFLADPWDLYCELRRINPAPFAAYMNLPWVQIVSSSPERFLELDRQGIAESRPIKGTRPRGKDDDEDDALYRQLFGSIKDRAENVMIVDLVRNDLGRVSEIGTVEVSELMAIEKYATVFQMVSTVRSKLRSGCDAFDLVRAAFPGGSMTGAPKIEAMKIIDRLEPVKRGIYSGALGYIDFAGNMDLSIVIRTMVIKNRRSYLGVGGAIVADSDPASEYQETLDKGRALITALRNVEGGDEDPHLG